MRQNTLPILASLVALIGSALPAAMADGMPDNTERTRYRSSRTMKHHMAARPVKVIYRDRIVTRNQIIERPVEKIVTVEKIVEKPIIIERTAEKLAVVEPCTQVLEQPLVIQRTEKKPFSLIRLHLFPRKHDN